MIDETYDHAIVGGGIVGLSTAWCLSKSKPGTRILLLEKEQVFARHQTGHNSGVIHSGIYYKPGSLKARYAVQGNRSMVEFCSEYGIAHEVCGKLIVATEPDELPRLDALHERGIANGLVVERIPGDEISAYEPHARGLAALVVPSTGIVDYRQVAETYARLVAEAGGSLRRGVTVTGVVDRPDAITIETTAGTFRTKHMVNCAGLHSDRVAHLGGLEPNMRIVPFRGEYYELVPERRSLVRNLIYPVPDPSFPFLGVHFTRGIDGTIHAGPNAVLGLKREGYRRRDVNVRDMIEIFGYAGFWRLAKRHARDGANEMWRSFSKAAFVRSMQRLIPDIGVDDVVPTHAGVRAQALMRDGTLADDFVMVEGPRSLHVCNAPSPAATASIEIGAAIVERIQATSIGGEPRGNVLVASSPAPAHIKGTTT